MGAERSQVFALLLRELDVLRCIGEQRLTFQELNVVDGEFFDKSRVSSRTYE